MSLEQPVQTVGSAPRTSRRSQSGLGQWLIAFLLMLVSAIPVAVGIYVVLELAAGHVRPETVRHLASPGAVILHVVCGTALAMFGAVQFVAPFRRRFPGWHRFLGRVLLVCGLIAGLSGMWITLFYPRLSDTNDLLFVIRLVFSSAMILSVVLGFLAVRQRDIPRHRAWMVRAYAIGFGVGTQALVFMVVEMVAGPPDQLCKALLMGASWLLNLAIAECVIRREQASTGKQKATMGVPRTDEVQTSRVPQ